MPRKKKRPLRFESLERRNLLAADISLIRSFDTWNGSPIHSTDPAGIGYHQPSGHLFLADSEIDEMSQYFTGKFNIFEISPTGDPVYRSIASNNKEPTGIVYSPYDGYFYVTNDDTYLLSRYNSSLNAPLKSVDTRNAASPSDPEDVTVDPATGTLYVTSGIDGGKQVLVYDSNMVFQSKFPVGTNVKDGEGIAFDPVTKNLFLVSAPDLAVFEFTTTGVFVQKFDISGFNPKPVTPQGAVFAPTSNPNDDPSLLALYIADGGIDNHASGRVYEAIITRTGGIGGASGDALTLLAPILASSDDAEEKATGSVTTNNNDLELVYDGTNQTVGLRFANIDIPADATIVDAYIQFQVDEVSVGSVALQIQGQAIDNAPTFTTQSKNVSSRSRTLNSVSWSPPDWNTVKAASGDQQTPDLSLIVQEIIDRPGWVQGNALALIISGTGHRVAESIEGGVNYAPKLRIQYRIGPAIVNTPPEVHAGVDGSVGLSLLYNLDASVIDAGGTLITTWSLDSGPGTVTFGNANAVDTTASFSKPGTYVLKLTAFDGEFTVSDSLTIQVTGTAIDVRVAASSDDAEESATGAVDLSSSDLELVQESTIQTVGLRFNGIAIPPGATITNAYVQFEVDEKSLLDTTLTIQAQDADNPTTFVKVSSNVSSRPRASTSVTWTPNQWPTIQIQGEDQRTSNIAPIIQQLVLRSGWKAGNSIVILITGTGKRTAEAFDGTPTASPLLHVEFNVDTLPAAALIGPPTPSESKKAFAAPPDSSKTSDLNSPTLTTSKDTKYTTILKTTSSAVAKPAKLKPVTVTKPDSAVDLLAVYAFFAKFGN